MMQFPCNAGWWIILLGTAMKTLIWKQWQESKTHFWIFIAWMVLAVGYAIAYELGHNYRAVIGSFSSLAMLYTFVAAIVLAARASQGEQTDGTLSFTNSLPIPIRRVATVRIVAATMTLAIPIVIASLILVASLATGLVEQAEPRVSGINGSANYIQMHLRPVGTRLTSLEQVASVTAIAILGGVELLLILSLCGCWLRSQAQVGFLGAVMALGCVIAAGLFWSDPTRWPLGQLLYGAVNPYSLVVHWGYDDGTGSYTDHELAKYRWWSLGSAFPFLMLIAGCFALRYGRTFSTHRKLKLNRFRLAVPSILSHITIPLRTRRLALVWLELRQSLPLACYGLLFAILVTIASQLIETGARNDFATSLRSKLPHSVFFVGTIWAVVVGSSLYSSDLHSKLGDFRRTRPISHAMWFWTKFLIGLAAVLMILDGVTILVSWNAPRTDMTTGMSYAYIACFPILHAFMYSLAVLGTCLFRQPLIGGVSAMLSFGIAMMAITSLPGTTQLEPLNIYNSLLVAERAGHVDFTQHGYPMVYGVLAASAVACSTVASRIAKPCQSTFLWLSRIQLKGH